MYKLAIGKAEKPEIKLWTFAGSQRKQGNSRKTSTSVSLTAWVTTNWKILQEMGIPYQLTCLLRNLYVSQVATVRTLHGTTDWFKIGKGVWQDCILSLCLFNFYAEYIMRNAKLDESQIGIKIDRRNINNLRCADDTTLHGRKWRGTKEPLDEGEWGEWKNWLKTQHSRN